MVESVLPDEAEKCVEETCDNKFIPRVSFCHTAEETLHERWDIRCGRGDVLADQGDVLENIINLVLERMTASEHLFHIKDDAVIDRV